MKEDKTDDNAKSPMQNTGELLKKKENPLDEVAHKLIDTLFNKDKLLMTSRLTIDYAKMIIRNTIISRFFMGYWSRSKTTAVLIPISVPPYYRLDTKDYAPDKKDAFKQIMKDLNEDLLQITIGFEGKGRTELTEIVKGLVGKVQEERSLFGIKY